MQGISCLFRRVGGSLFKCIRGNCLFCGLRNLLFCVVRISVRGVLCPLRFLNGCSASVAALPVASISLLPSCFGKTPSDVLSTAMLCATFPVSSTVCPSTKTPCCVSGTRTASASADKVFGLGKGFSVCCEVGFRLVIITTFFFFTVISLFVGMFPCVETVCGNYFFVLCKSVIFLLMYALCAQILL